MALHNFACHNHGGRPGRKKGEIDARKVMASAEPAQPGPGPRMSLSAAGPSAKTIEPASRKGHGTCHFALGCVFCRCVSACCSQNNGGANFVHDLSESSMIADLISPQDPDLDLSMMIMMPSMMIDADT